jgi:CheY-like chemotaxis protein
MPTSPAAILYVENNALLAQLVRDLFDSGGWHVSRAPNGALAKIFLGSEDRRYALMLVDNELHDLSGLELVKYARTLPRYKKSLPIILFSIEDCAQEAKAAGANEFLRKPHDLFLLMDIARKLIKG